MCIRDSDHAALCGGLGGLVVLDAGLEESVEPEQLGVMLFDGAETVGVGTMEMCIRDSLWFLA